MESQDLPPPPPPPPNQGWQNGKMARFWPSRGFILDLGGRTITFWRGGGGGKWKISHANIYFFYMDAAPAANDFFVRVSVFLQTL